MIRPPWWYDRQPGCPLTVTVEMLSGLYLRNGVGSSYIVWWGVAVQHCGVTLLWLLTLL